MSNFVDLSGQTFGWLSVLNRVENSIDKCGTPRVNYKVKCKCGHEFIRKSVYLKRKDSSKACYKNLCKMRYLRELREGVI
jgi:hypothetical protein